MTEVIQVFTTVDTRETAEIIARGLVEQRLAACVQVLGPLRSTYRWEGAIESAEEWLCLIKTTGAAYEALEKEIRAHHPYDVPEILAMPVTAGHSAYLTWLGAQIDR